MITSDSTGSDPGSVKLTLELSGASSPALEHSPRARRMVTYGAEEMW